ncbi:MAG: hypothetical protein PHO27_07205 [Sulfuricurvum sp.]|nr:hypothetical protein [Sulfuricurvum sp.]
MEKIDFISVAINDTQSTIRAIDVKIGALLTGMLLPIASLGKIWGHLNHLSLAINQVIAIIAGILFFSLWILAVLLLVRAISAIDSPTNHIIDSNQYKGSFFGAYLYRFGWRDLILNRTKNKAIKKVSQFLCDYPDSADSIALELTFEHMKLIYIRDMKLFRLNIALKIGFAWLSLGIGIYIFSKLL